MNNIDVWRMIEEIVENHEPPYCFEPCELEEIRQVRREKLMEGARAIRKTMGSIYE